MLRLESQNAIFFFHKTDRNLQKRNNRQKQTQLNKYKLLPKFQRFQN